MNLSTTDIIEYDLEVLQKMTGNQLLIQLIARKDLERPRREHQLQSDAIQAAAIATLKEAEQKLREQNLDFFADELAKIADNYSSAKVAA